MSSTVTARQEIPAARRGAAALRAHPRCRYCLSFCPLPADNHEYREKPGSNCFPSAGFSHFPMRPPPLRTGLTAYGLRILLSFGNYSSAYCLRPLCCASIRSLCIARGESNGPRLSKGCYAPRYTWADGNPLKKPTETVLGVHANPWPLVSVRPIRFTRIVL